MRIGSSVGVVFVAALVWGGVARGQTVADVSLQPAESKPAVVCNYNGPLNATPAEACGYQITPTYDETMAYLRRVQSAAPGQVKIEAFGKTGEGRELDVVVVS